MASDLKDMTFDDLVLTCCRIVLEHLLQGSLKAGVYLVCELTLRWKEATNAE